VVKINAENRIAAINRLPKTCIKVSKSAITFVDEVFLYVFTKRFLKNCSHVFREGNSPKASSTEAWVIGIFFAEHFLLQKTKTLYQQTEKDDEEANIHFNMRVDFHNFYAFFLLPPDGKK